MSRRELEQVAAQAGFQNPRIAAAIAMAESGGHVGAIGDQRLGGSFGLWQVHRPSHPEYDPHRLRNDPLYAARAAYEISKGGQDFSPWTTFRNGAFRRYLTDQQP